MFNDLVLHDIARDIQRERLRRAADFWHHERPPPNRWRWRRRARRAPVIDPSRRPVLAASSFLSLL